MKLRFTYGNGAVVLPAAVLAYIGRAGERELRVLLSLAADPMAAIDLDVAAEAAAARLSLSRRELDAALAFWRGTGLVAIEEGEALAMPAASGATPAAPQPRVIADKGLPAYSTDELNEILARRSELSALVDECGAIFGKILNPSEVKIIAGLLDYLGLEGEYILLLMTHCARIEKKSLRYLEKIAISLHDEGILAAADLEEHLHRKEALEGAVGRIRTMFGVRSRALTSKEKKMLENWICVMQYDDAVLTRAYEITVDSIGEASFPYANSILERWYAAGYRTIEDVESAIAEYRKKKNNAASSFDVDDFFEAALKRTYGG